MFKVRTMIKINSSPSEKLSGSPIFSNIISQLTFSFEFTEPRNYPPFCHSLNYPVPSGHFLCKGIISGWGICIFSFAIPIHSPGLHFLEFCVSLNKCCRKAIQLNFSFQPSIHWKVNERIMEYQVPEALR